MSSADTGGRKAKALATYLIDLSPDDMKRRLPEALRVYVDAMRYPRGTEEQRAALWLEHTRRAGWKCVAAVEVAESGTGAGAGSSTGAGAGSSTGAGAESGTDAGTESGADLIDAPLLGIAYGYSGAPDQWWQQQVISGLQRVGASPGRIAELMASYFELTELHIEPRAQGKGLGEALTRRLLAGRDESQVLLSTPEINGEANRAWQLYRRLGFTDVIRGYHFAGDPRPFAILGRPLPL